LQDRIDVHFGPIIVRSARAKSIFKLRLRCLLSVAFVSHAAVSRSKRPRQVTRR
jgi:hypothetical protein